VVCPLGWAKTLRIAAPLPPQARNRRDSFWVSLNFANMQIIVGLVKNNWTGEYLRLTWWTGSLSPSRWRGGQWRIQILLDPVPSSL
jgi:hypothetical protein